MKKTGRRFYSRLLAALISVAALLVIANFLAAWDLPRQIRGEKILSSEFRPVDDAILKYTFTPHRRNYHHAVWGVDISTNADGFRAGPFVPKSKKPRIVLLGDSISFGVYLEEEQNLAGRVSSVLDKLGRPVEIFNLGIPTYAMSQYAASYRRYGAALEPDIVLLQAKPGDFYDSASILIPAWTRRFPLAQWLWWRYQTYRLQTRTQTAGISAYHWLANECARNNIPLVVLFFPFLRPPSDDSWTEDKRELEKAGVPVVDVAAILKATGRELQAFRVRPDDVVHPNAEAISLVTDAVAPIIEERLRGLR
jgi:lysophospholipase L1-like esterase